MQVAEGCLIWFLMGKVVFHENQDLEENLLASCMLLQIHKKQYRKRKLKSSALVLAIFMMVERELEESKDKTAKRMFVEVFADPEFFLESFEKELAKTDEVDKEMGRQPMR